MDDERKSPKAGERAAEGLREATAKEEAKNESKMGHDLAKGADRFEERSKSSDGKAQKKNKKGECIQETRRDFLAKGLRNNVGGLLSRGVHPPSLTPMTPATSRVKSCLGSNAMLVFLVPADRQP